MAVQCKGKTLLAFSETALKSQILAKKLDSFTEYTITDSTKLVDELDKIRRNGYAIDREEITRGIVCVAAPIINHKAEVMASVSVTFPSYIANERGVDQEIEAVKNCANQMTQETGGNKLRASPETTE